MKDGMEKLREQRNVWMQIETEERRVLWGYLRFNVYRENWEQMNFA